jgi:putative membrane protein (TIGR04086 family)
MPQNFLKKFAVSTAIGTGVGMLSVAILIFLMAAALTIGDVPAMIISPVTVFFLAFGSFFGGFASAKLCGEKGFVCGALSGILFFIIVWIFGVFLENSGFGTAAIIKFVMMVVAGALGGIIGVNYIRRK